MHHTCRFLAIAVAAATALVRAVAAQTPSYYVAEVVPFPKDFTSNGDEMRMVKANAQGYILLEYDRALQPLPVPLIYKGNGEFIELSYSSLDLSADSPSVQITNISDVAGDGSFRVSGAYNDSKGFFRPVIWTVKADGSSSAVALENFVLPPESPHAGEQQTAAPAAVNSAGMVVGHGNSYLVDHALSWQLPSGKAHFLGNRDYSYATDVDEAGEFIVAAADFSESPAFTRAYYNNNVEIPVPGRHNGNSTYVRNGRAAGSYIRGTSSAGQALHNAYVYNAAAKKLITLPTFPEPGVPAADLQSEAIDLNNAGDLSGYSGGFQTSVLWKKHTDGSYTVHPLRKLVARPDETPNLNFTSTENDMQITNDNRLIVTVGLHNADEVSYYRSKRIVILRPDLNPPPRVQITSPAAGTQVAAGKSITFSGGVVGSDPVASIALTVDGTVVSRFEEASASINLSTLEPGEHVLQILATNAQGFTGRSAEAVVTVLPPNGKLYTFVGGSAASWYSVDNWSPKGIPGANDSVRLRDAQRVDVQGQPTITSLAITDDAAIVNGVVTVTGNFSWRGGSVERSTLTIAPGANLNICGDHNKAVVNSRIQNQGTTTLSGRGHFLADTDCYFINSGLLAYGLQTELGGRAETDTIASFGHFENTGRITLNGGTLRARSGLQQTAGQTDLGTAIRLHLLPPELLRGVMDAIQINFLGGVVSGLGELKAATVHLGDATLSPGNSPGAIEITGNLVQEKQSLLVMEVAGSGTPSEDYDQLRVSGSAALAGKLLVRTIDGYTPAAATQFSLLTYGTHSGAFNSVSANAKVTFGVKGAKVAVAGPNPLGSRLLNISTRLQIQGGDNGLIAGFIVTGPPGSTKKVLIRGLGPSSGVAAAISDPILELNGSGVHVVNDNWQQGDTSQIPDGFAPHDARESVIATTLTVGSQGYSSYTAGLRDTQGKVGVGIVEVYDLSANSAAQLANISTRGLVQTGDNVMIGSFFVGGDEPAKVLARVTGPSLTNISGVLNDPTLELHDSNGGVIPNDSWRETQEGAISATGIPPQDDRESAILATLVPGGYTAVVRGVANTTGVAIFEAYNVQ